MQSVLPEAQACTLQSARLKIARFQNNHNKSEFVCAHQTAQSFRGSEVTGVRIPRMKGTAER